MDYRQAAGVALVILLYGSILGGLLVSHQRKKRRIREEKLAGRLPARRSPSRAPSTQNPFRSWSFRLILAIGAPLPLLTWVLSEAAIRVFTPPEARIYLAFRPTFTRMCLYNLVWILFWAVLGLLDRLSSRLLKHDHFGDPAVRRATELTKAGDLETAASVVREAIDARGPSLVRCHTLAEILMAQGRWLEALKVSLDFEERWSLSQSNRYRKALALCKLGMPEVAIAELRRDDCSCLRRIDAICAYCRGLADLGLVDRAWDQLRRAEVLYGGGVYPEAERPRLREQIDVCRSRLAVHFVDKKPESFEEL